MARPPKTELDWMVGQRMKWHLQEQGLQLSQEELGARLGVHGTTVNRWFKMGRSPSRRDIQRFCTEFAADENWLLTGVRTMTPGEAIIKFGSLVAQDMDPQRAYASITGERVPPGEEGPLAEAAATLVEIIRAEAGPDLDRLSGSQVEERADRALRPLVEARESLQADAKTPAPNGHPALPNAQTRP